MFLSSFTAGAASADEAPPLPAPNPSKKESAEPPAAEEGAAADTSPGHVYVPHLKPRAMSDAPVTGAAPPAAPDAPTQRAPASGPGRGLVLEARFSQTLVPIVLAGGQAPTAALSGAPPFVAIGYRGDRYAILFGPAIGHYGASGQTAGVTVAGVSWHTELVATQSDDRTNELYALLGGSVAIADFDGNDHGVGGQPAYGLLVGMGARHWVSPHLGVHVELGESVTSTPFPRTVTASSSRADPIYITALATFGTMGISVLF
jgi:hypothetical protein